MTYVVIILLVILIFFAGIRIVRPTHRALIERLGKYQIVNLARTTLRNIIGTMTLKSANSERGKINAELYGTLEVKEQKIPVAIKLIKMETKIQ